jgi:hypothetical protein
MMKAKRSSMKVLRACRDYRGGGIAGIKTRQRQCCRGNKTCGAGGHLDDQCEEVIDEGVERLMQGGGST